MRPKLGEWLVSESLITRSQLESGLQAQQVYGGRFGTNLVELGLMADQTLAAALSRYAGVPEVTKEQLQHAQESVVRQFKPDWAKKFGAFPFRVDEQRRVHVAMLDPHEPAVRDGIGFALGARVVPYVVTELQLWHCLTRWYGLQREVRYIHLEPDEQERRALGLTAAEGAAYARASRTPTLVRERLALFGTFDDTNAPEVSTKRPGANETPVAQATPWSPGALEVPLALRRPQPSQTPVPQTNRTPQPGSLAAPFAQTSQPPRALETSVAETGTSPRPIEALAQTRRPTQPPGAIETAVAHTSRPAQPSGIEAFAQTRRPTQPSGIEAPKKPTPPGIVATSKHPTLPPGTLFVSSSPSGIVSALEGKPVPPPSSMAETALNVARQVVPRAIIFVECFGSVVFWRGVGEASDSTALRALRFDLERPSLFSRAAQDRQAQTVVMPPGEDDEKLFAALGGPHEFAMAFPVMRRGVAMFFLYIDCGRSSVPTPVINTLTRMTQSMSAALGSVN